MGPAAGYLEQSTRYIPYDESRAGGGATTCPPEVDATPAWAPATRARSTRPSTTYAALARRRCAHFRERFPQDPADRDGVYRATHPRQGLDTLRGLLPAATTANVGIFGSAQSYEALLLRMRAHPLAEVRACGDAMLVELRKVIPAFLTRVDRPTAAARGASYLGETRAATRGGRRAARPACEPEPRAGGAR